MFKKKKPVLQFFNTETREKENFSPHQDNLVRMYTCGPTVYNFAHIGNFRTYVFEDILRRTLKFFDFQVMQVMNLTDVDDKTIRGCIEKNMTLDNFTQTYKNAFFADIQSLGIERVEFYPAATDYIPQMIDFIQTLLDKNVAYQSSDKSIYFSIDHFPRYGRLSHLKRDELKVGAGDASMLCDEYEKDNITDFVLWKAYDPERDGKVYWESPFGPGRPGWHLECSTMAVEILGPTIDIHVGAVDNIFPHHENEIAQSECCTGKTFVRYWLHSEHLLVNHKKMSKSLGNFYTLRDLLDKGYTGMQVRYMLMQTHYRTQLNFTFEGMEAAKISLQRLNDFLFRMLEIADPSQVSSKPVEELLEQAYTNFVDAMAEDLNISSALAALFDMMREVNTLYDQQQFSPGDAHAVVIFLREMHRVLGIFDFEREDEKPSEELLALLDQRNAARASKQWAQADQLRNEILEKGYVIEDTPGGARLKKK